MFSNQKRLLCLKFLISSIFLFFSLAFSNLKAEEKKTKINPPANEETQGKSLDEPILIIDLKEVFSDDTGVPYRPYAVKFNRAGRIIVNEIEKREILIIDETGNLIKHFGRLGKADGEFLGNLGGIACDAENRIYVVDTHNHRVQVFDQEGNFLFKFGEFGTEEEKFSRPKGIVVDAYGKIYVTDALQNNIKVFDSKGRFLKLFGTDKGKTERPEWITIGKSGEVFVAHHKSPFINIYSPKEEYITSFAKKGKGPGEIEDDVEGIVSDNQGHIFVADEEEGKIQVYDERGKYLFSLGKGVGFGPGEFLSVRGIDFDRANKRLVVADRGNSLIQIFDLKDIFKGKENEEDD